MLIPVRRKAPTPAAHLASHQTATTNLHQDLIPPVEAQSLVILDSLETDHLTEMTKKTEMGMTQRRKLVQLMPVVSNRILSNRKKINKTR